MSYAVQPGADRGLAAELRQRSEGFESHILQGIVNQLAVAQQSVGHQAQAPVVVPQYGDKSGVFAATGGGQQPGADLVTVGRERSLARLAAALQDWRASGAHAFRPPALGRLREDQ